MCVWRQTCVCVGESVFPPLALSHFSSPTSNKTTSHLSPLHLSTAVHPDFLACDAAGSLRPLIFICRRSIAHFFACSPSSARYKNDTRLPLTGFPCATVSCPSRVSVELAGVPAPPTFPRTRVDISPPLSTTRLFSLLSQDLLTVFSRGPAWLLSIPFIHPARCPSPPTWPLAVCRLHRSPTQQTPP